MLKLRGCYDDTVLSPGISLATGDQSSTSMARGMLMNPLKRARLQDPEGVVKHVVHVDDTKQETHGSDLTKG